MTMPDLTDETALDHELAEIVTEVLDGIVETINPSTHPGHGNAPDVSIESSVNIAGEASAVFTIRAPAETAFALGAVMLGEAADSLDIDDACDILAELANMIGGTAKSLIAEETYLESPKVTVLDTQGHLARSVEVFHDLGRFEAHLEHKEALN